MKNYLQAGKVLPTVNLSGSDIAAGGAIVAGATLRVAIQAIVADATGQAYAEGVHRLPATTADVWADGCPLYWDATTGKLVDTDSSDVAAGYAAGRKLAGATTALIKLWPFGTTNAGGSGTGSGSGS